MPQTTPPNFIDLTGQTFTRLTVLRRVPCVRADYKSLWECRCTCGATTLVLSDTLRRGITKSCGCLRVETCGNNYRTHGRARTHEYVIWSAMKRRCYNVKQPNYERYGARGIRICDEWRNSFAAFLRDMGPCPPGHSIDRIDNNGNYEPGNCRWATLSMQNRNQRPRRAASKRA